MSQPKLIECPACGKSVSVAATSCPACGHPIVEEIKAAEAIPSETEDKKTTVLGKAETTHEEKKKSGCLVKGLQILGAITILLVVIGLFVGKDKTATTSNKTEISANTFPFSELEFITDIDRALQGVPGGVRLKKLTAEERNELGFKDPAQSVYLLSSGPKDGVILTIHGSTDKKIGSIFLARGKDDITPLSALALVVSARIPTLQGIKVTQDFAKEFASCLIEITQSPKQEKKFYCDAFKMLYTMNGNVAAFMFSPNK